MAQPLPPHTIDFSYLSDGERVHISVAVGLCSLSLVACVVPIYVYLGHKDRKAVWSHENNLIIGCVLMLLLQTASRITASILLLTFNMNETSCQGFAALDAAFDTSSYVLLLGFYYSMMAVRWNPIRQLFRCCTSDASYIHFRHFGWFVAASGVAAATGYFTATNDQQFGFMLGWCTGVGTTWVFMATTLAPLVLLVLSATMTMIALRCCVNADGGKGIALELTWASHWTIYVRFFAVIVFFLAAIVSTVVLHFSFEDDQQKRRETHSYIPVVIMALWPLVLAVTFLLTEGICHYFVQLCCGVNGSKRRRETAVGLDAEEGADAYSASAYHSPSLSLPHMGVRRDSYGAVSSSPSPRALLDEQYGDPVTPVRFYANEDSTPAVPLLTGGINNFTAAVTTLLNGESVGQAKKERDARQDAEDAHLYHGGGRATMGSRVGSTVYDDGKGETYSEIDDNRYPSQSLAGFTPPARLH